jgi:hypothetical protein
VEVLAYTIIPPDTETPGEGSRGAVVVSDYGSVIGPQGTVARRPDIDDFNPAAQHSNEIFHFNHDRCALAFGYTTPASSAEASASV